MAEGISRLTKMRDLQIRSTVNLERYAEGVKRKVFKILNKAQDEILATLVQSDAKRPITRWKRKRLSNLQTTINGIADKSYGKIKKITDKDFKQHNVMIFDAHFGVGDKENKLRMFSNLVDHISKARDEQLWLFRVHFNFHVTLHRPRRALEPGLG